jgi:hypothetical protein
MIGTTRATAKRDLEDLSAKKIVRLIGSEEEVIMNS